jgi:hypothetical protein
VRFGAELDTTVLATPIALQKHAFDLLGLSPTAEVKFCLDLKYQERWISSIR